MKGLTALVVGSLKPWEGFKLYLKLTLLFSFAMVNFRFKVKFSNLMSNFSVPKLLYPSFVTY